MPTVLRLKPFYGIPAKYKMNNQELPTKNSHFTGNIFTPLANFQQQNYEKKVKVLIIEQVCRGLYTSFKQMERDIVDQQARSDQLQLKYQADGATDKAEKSQDLLNIETQFKLVIASRALISLFSPARTEGQ